MSRESIPSQRCFMMLAIYFHATVLLPCLNSLSVSELQLAGIIGIISSHECMAMFTLLDGSGSPYPIILRSTHLFYILPL